jgi:hypothetical protein
VKFLSRRTHGIADYLVVVVFLSLPLALGLTGAPRTLSYAFAFLHLLVTGLGSFPPGSLPLLSFRVHAAVEFVAGLLLIASPWLLHFSDNASARNSFMILGAGLMLMAAFTDFDRRRVAAPPPPGDRRRWYSRKGG